jgi:tetratricopeptide (TPR) repeat protein
VRQRPAGQHAGTAALGDDYESAKAHLGEALRLQPRDVLALQAAHAFDYITGDMARMGDRVQAVLPAWSNGLPGYHAVLAMHAFSLEESGEYDRAGQAAHAALALNPVDARAHHAMAHVFEMTGRANAGARWMVERLDGWGTGSVVATHCWWHVALFHVAQGQLDRALALYDRHVRAGPSGEVADLIDSSALLWRIAMQDGDVGTRWAGLADAWSSHVDDAFCSFNDVHAMLAFVGAKDWGRAGRLEHALTRSRGLRTRYGATTRLVGLPACRALLAFGGGDDALAATLLASLPPFAHRLGGSQAQRDVLHLTRVRAIERIRGKVRRPPSRAAWLAPVAHHAP